MREIKFRAWDEKDKKMLYRGLFDKNWYGTEKNDDDGCHCIRSINQNDKYDLKIMQFIGLKDKNGKEIYELTELNNRFIAFYILTGYFLYDIIDDICYTFQEVLDNGYKFEITTEHKELSENQKGNINEYISSSETKKWH